MQAAGGRFLDSPMTRTPKEAAEGRLNLLVGGDAALLEECRPLLQCFAENISHMGPVGAGHSMKLLHNYVSLGMVTLLSEAAACAARNQVSPEAFVDVLAKGGGGGIALERLKPFLLAGQHVRTSLLGRQRAQGPGLLQHHGPRRGIAQGDRSRGAFHAGTRPRTRTRGAGAGIAFDPRIGVNQRRA